MAQNAGFTVINRRRVHLTPEQTSELYSEHHGKPFFSSLITSMSSGPLVALVLTKSSNTIAEWRALMGPEEPRKAAQVDPRCLRALFGNRDKDHRTGQPNPNNGVHGSDSVVAAHREIRFFFPAAINEPLPSTESGRDYVNKNINPTLIRGLTALVKAKPADPLRFLASWLNDNNPNTPEIEEPN